MALSKQDLEAIEALIESRNKVTPQSTTPSIIKPDVNIGDMLTKIATAVSLALLMWVGQSVSQMQTQQALIIQEQANQKAAMADLKSVVDDGTRDRYTRKEALDDHAELTTALSEFKTKQTAAFTRIEKMEQELAIMKATKK